VARLPLWVRDGDVRGGRGSARVYLTEPVHRTADRRFQ
jgi:hypothetical protein